MIKYLIVDDEFIAHDIIKGYCDLLPNFQLAKNCYDAIEAIEFLSKYDVDLIFLDLNMPKLKGFEFLRTLSSPPKVIVTTAYKEFAIEGYDLNIVDYLLKPFGFERFLKAINKATALTSKAKTDSFSKSDVRSIFLRSNKKHIQVTINDILFLESAGNYTRVVTADTTISVREKISDLLISLPANDFIKVHKSYAVAKKHIDSIEGNRISIDHHLIPVGSIYKMNVSRLLSP